MAEKLLFPGQGADEKVIIFERKHWYLLYQWLRLPVAILLLFALIAWMLGRIPSLPRVVLALPGTAILMLTLWIAWRAADWENDRYIVTDKRVIHIEKVPFIREKRDEAPLGMIQDVSVEMKGLMPNLLYFGNVIIQTAGTLGTVRFIGIRKPRKAQAQILALVEQIKGYPLRAGEEEEDLNTVRRIVGLPPVEPKPLPPTAEGLRWESERARREQIPEVLKRMLFPKPIFGEDQIIWRKHWWILFTQLISPSLILLTVIAIWVAIGIFHRSIIVWADLLLGISLVIIGLRIAWLVIDWRNDLYVVTNERVIDIEKVPFRYEHRREAGLDKIQDVRYLQPNIIARILDFGHVRLETAGEIGEFTFDSVPHPRQVQVEIFKRLERFRRRAEQERANEFLKWLARYHRGIMTKNEAK